VTLTQVAYEEATVAIHHISKTPVRSQSKSISENKIYRSTVPGLSRIRFSEDEVVAMISLWHALHAGSRLRNEAEALRSIGVARIQLHRNGVTPMCDARRRR
jgi:hypothetical protein